jgi:hypothetical protein
MFNFNEDIRIEIKWQTLALNYLSYQSYWGGMHLDFVVHYHIFAD